MITRRPYSIWLILLCIGPLCVAQEVKVRVVNASNGLGVQKQAVSVSFLYDKEYDKEIPAKYDVILRLETNVNGEAHFRFPEPPPVHFSAGVRVDWSHWKCGCTVLVSTDEVLRRGIVGPVAATTSKKSEAFLKAAPGEILFAFRPLSLIERLLYPIMEEVIFT